MKTVGDVDDGFIVHNNQGVSKGMAIVTFAREGDAFVARAKYNGRKIDARTYVLLCDAIHFGELQS